MIRLSRTGELQQQLDVWRSAGQIIVLVPTMGNLHPGHLQLVEQAQKQGDRVVVSIFVNPIQFVAGEDFDDYPRTLDADLDKLEQLDIDLVYVPDVSDIYPDDIGAVQVSVPALDGIYCGASRPGHFTGVATVVTRLFNLIRPHKAVFGEKDYQQLLVIQKLVRDLHIPVEILAHSTVREADGLAMSSRNQYLTHEQRGLAALLYRTLCATRDRILSGDRDYSTLEEDARNTLDGAGLQVDYFSIAAARDLRAPKDGDLVILAAVWLGRARLIDNLRLQA
ncbi:MAG: pantoate--beta-alanine ligase [Thiotrichales bacterium]|nr:pantoate--beta-alanine ligase [Thiotrichales bacterium]